MERFEIGCSVCGVLCYEERLADALRRAVRLQEGRHTTDGETVTVYDRMAHRGKPERYTPSGVVLKRKS